MRLRSRDTLRAVMAQKSVGLDALSRAAGVNRSFISHLTSGRRNGCTYVVGRRICERLDVPLNVLFMDATSPDSNPAVRRRKPAKKVEKTAVATRGKKEKENAA